MFNPRDVSPTKTSRFPNGIIGIIAPARTQKCKKKNTQRLSTSSGGVAISRRYKNSEHWWCGCSSSEGLDAINLVHTVQLVVRLSQDTFFPAETAAMYVCILTSLSVSYSHVASARSPLSPFPPPDPNTTVLLFVVSHIQRIGCQPEKNYFTRWPIPLVVC